MSNQVSTAELLVELFSEEIPARMQVQAAEQLLKRIETALKAASLTYETALCHSTPRRLVVAIKGLPLAQPDNEEEKRGPRVGAPEQALQGFLKVNSLASIEEAEIRETSKGQFYFAVKKNKGQATLQLLPKLLEEAIAGLSWPKSMRWGRGSKTYVRPLHAILALFNGQALEGRLSLSEEKSIPFGTLSQGHRFMAPDAFEVSSFDDLSEKLAANKVILSRDARRSRILTQLETLANKQSLKPIEDQALLDEIVGLVEWPKVILGQFDQGFLSVPREVLITSMREHQKFFAFETSKGELAPFFATVANREPHDDGSLIRAGNERVLRARLSDAKFFWEQDKEQPLDDNVPQLDAIVFHAKLGSLGQKVERMSQLAGQLAVELKLEPALAQRAALLAKADLVSQMVYEFPELQGLMGSYYARAQGEDASLAQAIAEHYSPLGPQEACPNSPLSVVVAMADKLDTLAGFWLIDEKPTGSKDPFALRRAALGLIRLLVENDLRLPVKKLLALAFQAYGSDKARPEADAELWDFIKDRATVSLRDQGVTHDLIKALFAVGDEDDLTLLFAKARSLAACLAQEEGQALVAGYRQACNILAAEEKKAPLNLGPVDLSLLQDSAEQALFDAINRHMAKAKTLSQVGDFDQAFATVAALRPFIGDFFVQVMVNSPDPEIRINRLSLLNEFRQAIGELVDLSKLG